MPQRDFRNTMGYLDLLARQDYQNKQLAKQNQVEAEQRAAEYGGVQQLLKGVGQEQERIRQADVRKAGAGGVGAAINNNPSPTETGDIETDAAAQEGFQNTRLKLVSAKATQDAILARLLASQNDPYKQRRLDQADERLAALEGERQWAHVQKDEDQERLQRNADMSRYLQALGILDGEGRPRFRPTDNAGPGIGPTATNRVPGVEPNTPPPGVIPDNRTTTSDAQKNLDDLLAIRPQFEQVNKNFANLEDSDFGGYEGGTVPVIGDDLKRWGIPQNRNEYHEWRRNNPKYASMLGLPDLTPEEIAGVNRRALFAGSRKDLSSIITLIRTGKVANQMELKNIDAMQGFIDSQDFGRNRETTGKVLQQLFDIYNANVARMQQRRKQGGLLEQSPVAGPMDSGAPKSRGQSETGQMVPSPPANGGAQGALIPGSKAYLAKAQEIQARHPELSNDDVFDIVDGKMDEPQ